jgi:lipopolysaccharide/colanic/teichoic acid biosynthesis glycosyltransferase
MSSLTVSFFLKARQTFGIRRYSIVKFVRSNRKLHTALPTVSGVDRGFLDADAFNKTISLERKRTERSQRLFLLMLLDVKSVLANAKDEKSCADVLAALSMSIRETDVIGWHDERAVIGVLFTEIPEKARNSIVSTMLLRISGVLYSKLAFETFNQISISHHVFPENWDHDVPQRPSHPSLYPDLASREKDTKVYSAVKRVIDVVGSAAGLIMGAPLFLAIAAAIKLTSSGPVLFRQVRVGQYGETFLFLKFRSMHVGNDPSIHREYVKALIGGHADRKDSDGKGQGVYKLTRDPRITRVGDFLRKTSLDELPQLYNVLKGEMSLVGPRPAIPYEVEAYETWHRRRVLEAKPGITGLWQVNGRSRVTFDEMVRLDVRYAMTRSVWLDLKTLLNTPRAVILGEGAH